MDNREGIDNSHSVGSGLARTLCSRAYQFPALYGVSRATAESLVPNPHFLATSVYHRYCFVVCSVWGLVFKLGS